MSNPIYSFGRGPFGGGARDEDFSQFVELVKGRSIVTREQADDSLEIGLSGDIHVRISKAFISNALEIICFSIQDEAQPQSVVLSIGDMPQAAPAWQLETKLRGLRTQFAILQLANNGDRWSSAYLKRHPFGDLDRFVEDYGLAVESISYGSWVTVIRSKAKDAQNSIAAIATIFLPRARDAFIKKLEAEADLKEVESQRAALALNRDKFELSKAQAEYMIDLVNRAGDSETQTILQMRLRKAIYELAVGDENEQEIRANTNRLLPGGTRRQKK